MRFNRDVHHRRSIRLRGFDYSQPGAYFITVCTHGREPLFGDVVDGVMVLNDAGRMVEKHWHELANKFTGIHFGEYVTMPNHIHGVVEIAGAPLVGAPMSECSGSWAPTRGAPTDRHGSGHHNRAPTRGAPTVGNIVGAFKSLTTNAYIDGVNHAGWLPFECRLWQRNYYEHIIRNEQAHAAIADYIRHNPLRWQDDVYCCH